MLFPHKLVVVVVCASSLVLGQAPGSFIPTQGSSNQESSTAVSAVPPAESAAQSNPTIPDSTKLEVIKEQKPDYPLEASQNGIQGQVWLKMVVSETGDVEEVSVISGEPVLAKAAVEAGKKWKFKPFVKNGKPIKVPIRVPFNFHFSQKVMTNGVSEDKLVTSSSTPPPNGPFAASDSKGQSKRVRVSQGVAQGLLIQQIAPVYPWAAKQMRIQGSVVLGAIIGKDGRVSDIKVISGHSMLAPAAIGAVQQWRYRPYLLQGEPVEVDTQITVNFQLR